MKTLKIRLFGQLELLQDGKTFGPFPTRKSRELFCFLALNWRRVHLRDVLAATFWGDSPDASARKCLRTEVWRIRRLLAATGIDALAVDNEGVGLNTEADLWVDVMEFEKRLAPYEDLGTVLPLDVEGSRQVREAVELFRGELLEGNYNDWCVHRRERMNDLFLSALEKLMHFHQVHRKWGTATYYAKQILSHDPLIEHVHRDLMRYYWEMGNRAAALRQYARCSDLLMKELDVGPMPETANLYRRIKAS